MRNMDKAPNRNRVFIASLIILVGGLSLSACSGESAPDVTPGAVSQPPTEGSDFTFTFDALGGGSPIIQVYAGPGNSAAEKIATGTYNDGDTADPNCRTEGRPVPSDPSSGEQEKESDQWVKLNAPGPDQYATMTYGDVSPDYNQLPAC